MQGGDGVSASIDGRPMPFFPCFLTAVPTHAPPSSQVYSAGVAATALAIIPDWPWFNRSPLTWLPVKEKIVGFADDAEDADDADDADAPSGSGARSPARQRRLPVIE